MRARCRKTSRVAARSRCQTTTIIIILLVVILVIVAVK